MRNEAQFRKFTAFASACAVAMLSPTPAVIPKIKEEKCLRECQNKPEGSETVKSRNVA